MLTSAAPVHEDTPSGKLSAGGGCWRVHHDLEQRARRLCRAVAAAAAAAAFACLTVPLQLSGQRLHRSQRMVPVKCSPSALCSSANSCVRLLIPQTAKQHHQCIMISAILKRKCMSTISTQLHGRHIT